MWTLQPEGLGWKLVPAHSSFDLEQVIEMEIIVSMKCMGGI